MSASSFYAFNDSVISDRSEIRKLVNTLPPQTGVHYHFRKNAWTGVANNSEFEQKSYKTEEYGFYKAHELAVRWRDAHTARPVNTPRVDALPSSLSTSQYVNSNSAHSLQVHPSKLAWMAAMGNKDVESPSMKQPTIKPQLSKETTLNHAKRRKRVINKEDEFIFKKAKIQNCAPLFCSSLSLHRYILRSTPNFNCLSRTCANTKWRKARYLFQIEKWKDFSKPRNRCRCIFSFMGGDTNGKHGHSLSSYSRHHCLWLPHPTSNYRKDSKHGFEFKPKTSKGNTIFFPSLVAKSKKSAVHSENNFLEKHRVASRKRFIRELVHSDSCNASSALGEDFEQFDSLPKCKGVNYHKYCQCWVAAWCEKGKQLKKRFSVRRHGFLISRRLAMEERRRNYEWKFLEGSSEFPKVARALIYELAVYELLYLREAQARERLLKVQERHIELYKSAILFILKDLYNVCLIKLNTNNKNNIEHAGFQSFGEVLDTDSCGQEHKGTECTEIVQATLSEDWCIPSLPEHHVLTLSDIQAYQSLSLHESFIQNALSLIDIKMYLDLPLCQFCLENKLLPCQLPQPIQHCLLVNMEMIAQVIEIAQVIRKLSDSSDSRNCSGTTQDLC